MLKSRIRVDLPSAETDRRMGPIDWIRSTLGAEIDLKSGKEELTVGAMTLTTSLVEAFQADGIDNAIAFLVDKKVIFKDTEDEASDLHRIPQAAQTSGILDKPFKEMHMVLTHHEDGIHYLFDVRIVNRVMLGDDEMSVDVSGRIEDLRVRQGETAKQYAQRVEAFATKDGNAEHWRRTFEQRVQAVGRVLERKLSGGVVDVAPARIELIRPTNRQVARFADLDFGNDVTEPTYRAVPSQQRAGAYSDPFYYYYFDPYYDYTHHLILATMATCAAWHLATVTVTSPEGEPLFWGSQAENHLTSLSEVGPEALSFDGDGGIVVADSVLRNAREAAAGASGADLFTDSGDEESDGGFFSEVFAVASDAFSDASCGSSCSGGSCGSSCGGCGGCGG